MLWEQQIRALAATLVAINVKCAVMGNNIWVMRSMFWDICEIIHFLDGRQEYFGSKLEIVEAFKCGPHGGHPYLPLLKIKFSPGNKLQTMEKLLKEGLKMAFLDLERLKEDHKGLKLDQMG